MYGLDRAPAVKAFNDGLFTEPHLHYVAADIGPYLTSMGDLSDTLFMVMRAAVIFPKPFIADLFRAAHVRRTRLRCD